MGSGRKRPLERGSPNPMAGDVEGRKKKKGKKIKERKESISTTAEPTNNNSPMESTATAEGKIMSQVMSTFNRLEQSRFEAFRRAGFPADAVSTFVAHCLIDEHGQSGRRAPILSELCAPGQAEEICIVVSTLAKAYAQRLVTAARRLATTTSNEPITPDQILAAFRDRQAKGLDPGFFLQAASSTTTRTVLQNESYHRKRLAALKAQDDYDKMFPPPSPTTAESTDTAMDEDTEQNYIDLSAAVADV